MPQYTWQMHVSLQFCVLPLTVADMEWIRHCDRTPEPYPPDARSNMQQITIFLFYVGYRTRGVLYNDRAQSHSRALDDV